MLLQMTLFLFFFIAEQYSIVYMYHIFFIHSSVSGHLGYFYVLTIVNSAAVNIGAHVSFWITVFSGYVPRMGLLDHMVALFLGFSFFFKEDPYCFSP